jgi:ABC-type dipeptide/oligopeptide/nickel transport system permease component
VRHDVLKNVLVPVITIAGIELGALLAGTVVIETVFAWPGLGLLLLSSLGNRDYSVLQALLVLFVAGFLVSSLIADLLTATVDPRIRLGGRATS